jgi:RNA polymerase sigma factor for flagellar operon FliA
VLDYIRSQDFFSRKIRRQIKDVQKAVNELVIKNQQMPTDEEIAVYLNTSVPLVQKALQDASHVMMSLDTYTEQDGENDGFRYEMMIDENQPDPSNIFEEHDLKYRLVEAIRMLPEREQLVLSLYYYEELTLKEIGAVLKISESRVCQLHARSMMSMKALLQNQDAPSMHEEQV